MSSGRPPARSGRTTLACLTARVRDAGAGTTEPTERRATSPAQGPATLIYDSPWVESFGFNVAIDTLYAFTNAIAKSDAGAACKREALMVLAQLMAPMTPHLSEEIWHMLGGTGLVAEAPWPAADDRLLVEDTITLPVQVNGKRRSEITVAKDLPRSEIEALALADESVMRALDGGPPKKVIVVPGRIVNVVV